VETGEANGFPYSGILASAPFWCASGKCLGRDLV
jgi:hypothetical protein